MKKNAFLCLFILATTICCTYNPDPPQLGPCEFSQALRSDSNAILIDVCRPEEFARCHIPGATLHNVLDSAAFHRRIDSLNPQSHYYLYCMKGVRSMQAARILQQRGFRVTSLHGGLKAWKSEGLPVDSSSLHNMGL